MHKCTTYSASRLFHLFLKSARSGSTRYQNAMLNNISSDRTSYYADGLMHSVFAERLNLSQVKDSVTQIHTRHCGNIPCLNTLVRSVRYLIILLKYTLHYYSVELYPALLQCCCILYHKTLLGFTQS